jgi:glycosyltransferase involved in cell wall biosynthesis
MAATSPGPLSARGERARLLAIGPALDQSSYARVVESTLAPLAHSWEILQLAVNHRGEARHAGWQIVPNPHAGDRFGVASIGPLVSAFRADALFLFNAFHALPRYGKLPELLGDSRPPLVAQCPVLEESPTPELVARLAFFDCIVVLAESVRRHFAACFDACMRNGSIPRIPALHVIPHGLDTSLFHPIERSVARARIPALRDLPTDAFVVLNANRNLVRKRIDLTMEGFARFASGKPPGVVLYLHMGETSGGSGLRDAAMRLGIGDRVIVASTEPGGHPALDDTALNDLYNACDVGVNTSSCEGWGMISFEHGATGAAQIVPRAGISGETWRDNAVERLYRDPGYRAEMSTRGAAFARRPEFQWTTIAAHWDTLLRRLGAAIS